MHHSNGHVSAVGVRAENVRAHTYVRVRATGVAVIALHGHAGRAADAGHVHGDGELVVGAIRYHRSQRDRWQAIRGGPGVAAAAAGPGRKVVGDSGSSARRSRMRGSAGDHVVVTRDDRGVGKADGGACEVAAARSIAEFHCIGTLIQPTLEKAVSRPRGIPRHGNEPLNDPDPVRCCADQNGTDATIACNGSHVVVVPQRHDLRVEGGTDDRVAEGCGHGRGPKPHVAVTIDRELSEVRPQIVEREPNVRDSGCNIIVQPSSGIDQLC